MKHRIIITVIVAMAATAVYIDTSPATSTGWTVEHYYTDETSHTFADIGPKGAGPDDIYVAQQSLTTTDGKDVGLVNGYGVNLHPPYVFFHWTAVLSTGSLTIAAAINLKEGTQIYPIEGGTGRYADAHGTVTLTDAGKKGSLVTVRYER